MEFDFLVVPVFVFASHTALPAGCQVSSLTWRFYAVMSMMLLRFIQSPMCSSRIFRIAVQRFAHLRVQRCLNISQNPENPDSCTAFCAFEGTAVVKMLYLIKKQA